MSKFHRGNLCRAPAVIILGRSGQITSMSQTIEIIVGTILAGGVICPLLQLDDGRVFALQGFDRSAAQIGDRVSVSGQPIMMSTCQQGPAFLVTAIIPSDASAAKE